MDYLAKFKEVVNESWDDLTQYHNCEKYNPDKHYEREDYEFNYGHGSRTYRNVLHLLDRHDNEHDEDATVMKGYQGMMRDPPRYKSQYVVAKNEREYYILWS